MQKYCPNLQVIYYAGSKVIEIKSAVIIENQTNTPVDLLVQMGNTPYTFHISPGSKMPVPAHCARKGLLSVRPGEQGFEWSERVECSTLSAKKGSTEA
jgi:hypothetical protein